MTRQIAISSFLFCAAAVCCYGAEHDASTPGDRHPDIRCVYPSDVFLHAKQGGRVIDVTRPPFLATGDGVTDDTDALIRAYEFVLSEMDKAQWNPAGPESDQYEYIIYLPSGTYLVSDTIIYRGPWRHYPGKQQLREGKRVFERLVKIRFFGQERSKTIIRLKDQCPGFDRIGSPKPVVSYGKSDLNNAVAYNAFRNITINTGRGNPGAIGLDFCGANNSGIHNVSVVSGDGQGVAGIDFRICPAMGFHDDITVHGFDYGIRSLPYHMTHNSFEFLTLANQNKAGFQIGECSASIRKLRSTNRVPAITVTTPSGQVVLLDSRLEGNNHSGDAILAEQGQLFARSVETSRYAAAIRVDGKIAVEGPGIDEFVTGKILSLREGQRGRSLNLRIEETPSVEWETDFGRWANVDRFGARGDGKTDDSAAVQAAMNSGRPIVYFPKAVYRFRSPVTVPASVRRVIGFYGTLHGQFLVSDDAKEPLLIEDFGTDCRVFLRHQAPRTLILSHMRCSYFNQNKEQRPKVFINNCNGLGKTDRVFINGDFWVRFMNTEHKRSPNFTCNASNMWVFGYKVEGHMTNFESIGGGRLEVLGGICNEHGDKVDPETPILRNVDSSLCYVGCTNGPNQFQIIVEETIRGGTRRLIWDDLPARPGSGKFRRWNDVLVPLYVSEAPAE